MPKKNSNIILIIIVILIALFAINKFTDFNFLGSTIYTIDDCAGNAACVTCISQDHYCSNSYEYYYVYYDWGCGAESYQYCSNGCAYGHCLDVDYGAVCFPDGTKLCTHTYYEGSTGGILCDVSNIVYCDGSCVDGACTSEAGCDDSDNGLNKYVYGTVTYLGNSYNDVCDSSTVVREFYCNEDNVVAFSYLNCGTGYSCSSGKCISGTTTTTPTTTTTIPSGTYLYRCIDGTISQIVGSSSTTLGNCGSGSECGYDGDVGNQEIESTMELTLDYLKESLCTICVSTTEICDLKDNDCDGVIDEGLNCGVVEGDSETITWTTYFSTSNSDLFESNYLCKSDSDCSSKSGYTVSCNKEADVKERLAEARADWCAIDSDSEFGWLINSIVVQSGVYICEAVSDVISQFSNSGVCIAESENSIGGFWESVLKTVAGFGIPPAYVLMATIGGFILIILVITRLF